MTTHKIQSSSGLQLDLKQVPKRLGVLTREWAPQAFVVSFKLETDAALVETKARAAIDKYGVALVVANQLQTRRDIVYLVGPDTLLAKAGAGAGAEACKWLESGRRDVGGGVGVVDVHRPPRAELIEPTLVAAVQAVHVAFLSGAAAAAPSSSSSSSSSSSATIDATFRSAQSVPARYIHAYVERYNNGGKHIEDDAKKKQKKGPDDDEGTHVNATPTTASDPGHVSLPVATLLGGAGALCIVAFVLGRASMNR